MAARRLRVERVLGDGAVRLAFEEQLHRLLRVRVRVRVRVGVGVRVGVREGWGKG